MMLVVVCLLVCLFGWLVVAVLVASVVDDNYVVATAATASTAATYAH